MKKINTLPLAGILLLTTLLVVSCSKDDEPRPYIPQAAIRLVNAYPYSQAIVFTENNNFINLGGVPIRYNEYTTNLSLIFPGEKNIKVYANDNKLISDTTFSFRDSTYYTSYVFGNTTKAQNLITKDVSLQNIGTKTGLRFFHLAQNQANVNVYLNDLNTPLFTNRPVQVVANASESPNTIFTSQNSGKQKVIITDLDNNILIQREYDFNQSRYYTILLTGDKNSTSQPLYLGIVQQ